MASEAEQAAHDDAHRLRSAGQEDARALEHQAAHDKHPDKAVKGTEAKLAKHRDLIVVSLTLVGIVIGYLSFRQAKSSSAGDSSSSDTSSGDTSATDDNGDLLDGYTSGSGSSGGYVVGGGDTSAGDTSSGTAEDAAFAGLTTYLSNLSAEITSLDQSVGALAGKGPIPTSPHHPKPIKAHPPAPGKKKTPPVKASPPKKDKKPVGPVKKATRPRNILPIRSRNK